MNGSNLRLKSVTMTDVMNEMSAEFDALAPIQRTILIEISHHPFSQPTSKAVIQSLRASTSGIKNALDGLLKHDHVYIDETGDYRILNPLTEYILRQATNVL